MTQPRIAIATCADYPELKGDDELLCEALRERGCEAESVVWDEKGVEWGRFDLCLVRSTWDYHDKYSEFLTWTRQVERASALHNPAALIAWNSNKTYLRQLADAGVPTVPTLWVERGSDIDLEHALSKRGWEEVVVKPVVDLGAKNLHRVRAGNEANAALASVLARSNAMVQPFLPSLESEGELSLIYIQGSFSHAVHKRPATGDFRVQSIWGGTMTAANAEAQHIDLAQRALAQLSEPPLYARIDLVSDLNGNPALIELELIEPNLYLSTNRAAADHLANAVVGRLS
jgi:glutathione synthase/RimK-type ligase-like ATP-grasp enzyme